MDPDKWHLTPIADTRLASGQHQGCNVVCRTMECWVGLVDPASSIQRGGLTRTLFDNGVQATVLERKGSRVHRHPMLLRVPRPHYFQALFGKVGV